MLEAITGVFQQTLLLALEAAPWILAGLIATALFKAFVNPQHVVSALGEPGFRSAWRAALFGAPLPMCSCGVLPAAFALHRGGASKGATASFMVSVPETNPEAVVVSWGMLGPALAIIRPVTAIIAAITTGVLVDRFAGATHAAPRDPDKADDSACCDHDHAHDHGHAHDHAHHHAHGHAHGHDCCGDDHSHAGHDHHHAHTPDTLPPAGERIREGLLYAFTEVIDGIAKWIVIGLLVAGIITALLPANFLGSLGSGPIAILVALLVSIPVYVCASGSIPMGAAMLFAGASPGVVLAFLLAGPSTNIATMGAVRREMGARVMWIYTGTIAATAFIGGMAVDALWPLIATIPDAVHAHVDVGQDSHSHSWIPLWMMWGSLIILAAASIKPVRRAIIRPLTGKSASAT